ncbi:MAG TPA: hypothetical protein VH476_04325 [Solirubrobacterales bacterium]
MTGKSTKRLRPTRFLTASALAAIAMLVLAGPASAHHGHHHHHRHHHRHSFDSQQGPAGTIASFDPATGKLTINLEEEETITGFVTEDTVIEFSHSCDHHGEWSDHEYDRSGHRRLWEHGGWDQSNATTEDLVPGATVDDAVLIVAGGKATFVKIDLAPPSTDEQQPQPTT